MQWLISGMINKLPGTSGPGHLQPLVIKPWIKHFRQILIRIPFHEQAFKDMPV